MLQYYQAVATTACVSIPNMENWKCASLAGTQSLSIATTTAIIAIVFLTVAGAYIGHAVYFQCVAGAQRERAEQTRAEVLTSQV